MKIIHSLPITLAILNLFSCCSSNSVEPNVILFIGDGMGLSQVSAGMLHSAKPLNLEKFEHVGLIKTSSATEEITDSAAGATAFSTGQKTYNGAIGVDVDTSSLTTIFEEVKKMGYSTGLIATSSITHATPASFYAHVSHRKKEEEIASQLPNAEVDFIAAGGRKYFTLRNDRRNLLTEMTENNYRLTKAESESKIIDELKYCFLLADKEMPTVNQGRGNFLQNYVVKALDFLSKKQRPFFLVVEGSQIDWGGHNNEISYLIDELLDFDSSLGIGLSFANENQNTLVLVTADHETGGLTLPPKNDDYTYATYEFSTKHHTATLIPVFASGHHSEAFSGIYENTEIFNKLKRIIGF